MCRHPPECTLCTGILAKCGNHTGGSCGPRSSNPMSEPLFLMCWMPGHGPISGANSEERALRGAYLVRSQPCSLLAQVTFAYPLSLCHHARAFRISIRGHMYPHMQYLVRKSILSKRGREWSRTRTPSPGGAGTAFCRHTGWRQRPRKIATVLQGMYCESEAFLRNFICRRQT